MPVDAVNLDNAATFAAIAAGVDGVPPTLWTQDMRLEYIQTLAQAIVSSPEMFSDQTLHSAQIVLGQNFDGLALDDFINSGPDGSASLAKIFLDELGNQAIGPDSAVNAIAHIGTAAINVVNKLASAASNTGDAAEKLSKAAANSSSWLGPVALVGVVVLLVFAAEKKVARTFS